MKLYSIARTSTRVVGSAVLGVATVVNAKTHDEITTSLTALAA